MPITANAMFCPCRIQIAETIVALVLTNRQMAILLFFETNDCLSQQECHTVNAPYNDHTGLQQFGHCSALLLKRYNDI